jgi:fucose permease
MGSVVSYCVPVGIDAYGAQAVNVFFSTWCLVGIVFMAIFIKETKGKSAREISQLYAPKTNDQSERWINPQTD